MMSEHTEAWNPNTPSPVARPVDMNSQPQRLAQDVQFEMVVNEGKGRGKPAMFGQPLRSPPSPFVEMTSTDLWRMAQVADSAARKSWADQRSPGPSPGPVFLHPNKYGPSTLSRPGSMEQPLSRTTSMEVSGIQHSAVMEEDEEDGSMDEAEHALRERRRLVTTVQATPEPPSAAWVGLHPGMQPGEAFAAMAAGTLSSLSQPQPHRFNHTCKHWKQGNCNLGDACKFQHPPREEMDRKREEAAAKRRGAGNARGRNRDARGQQRAAPKAGAMNGKPPTHAAR